MKNIDILWVIVFLILASLIAFISSNPAIGGKRIEYVQVPMDSLLVCKPIPHTSDGKDFQCWDVPPGSILLVPKQK